MDIEYLDDAKHGLLQLGSAAKHDEAGSWARKEAPATPVTLGPNTGQYTHYQVYRSLK